MAISFSKRLAYCVLAFWLSFAHPDNLRSSEEAIRHAVAANEIICGPRCVRYVLHLYGIEDDLVDLTKEIQWPTLEKGASLLSMSQALNKRLIYTKAVRFESEEQIDWPYPTIAHLKGADEIGHYVVVLPSTRDGVRRIWQGSIGESGDFKGSFGGKWSGVILLTAPYPIALESLAPKNQRIAYVITLVSGICAFVIAGRYVHQLYLKGGSGRKVS